MGCQSGASVTYMCREPVIALSLKKAKVKHRETLGDKYEFMTEHMNHLELTTEVKKNIQLMQHN